MAGRVDYMNWGCKVGVYIWFLFWELLLLLRQQYWIDIDLKAYVIVGFLLGGFFVFDVGWYYLEVFGQIGVFLGLLWWCFKLFWEEVLDVDCIVQIYVEVSNVCLLFCFWLQAGIVDEQVDCNNNGIIDVIDDMLDLIRVLEIVGYD